MGFFEFFRIKRIADKVSIKHDKHTECQKNEISNIDKEMEMVRKVTTSDMLQFKMLPYDMFYPVHTFIKNGGHPFAYMDLSKINIMVARDELDKINEYIIQAKEYIPFLTSEFYIQIDKIIFEEYDYENGYTRLICSPYTYTGKVSKYPLMLSFMTRMDTDSYRATGELFYGVDGNIIKANVNIRNGYVDFVDEGVFWQFTFKTIGRTFLISQAKTNLKLDKNGLPGIVYEFN